MILKWDENMTKWLEEAKISIDKAMREYHENTYLCQVVGKEDERVRHACKIAYAEGMRNANRRHEEMDS